jgi:hypothetical protein
MPLIILTAFACLLFMGGCSKDTPVHSIHESSEKSSSARLTNENAGKIIPFEENQHFTEIELKVATVAKDFIEEKRKGKFDARYEVEKNPEGWLVTIYYIGSYHDGRSNFAPGGSCGYQVSEKTWRVEEIYPGF